MTQQTLFHHYEFLPFLKEGNNLWKQLNINEVQK